MGILVGSGFTVGAIADAEPLQVEGENRRCGKDLEALGSVRFGFTTVLVSHIQCLDGREPTFHNDTCYPPLTYLL